VSLTATELAQLADHYWLTRAKRLDADKVAKDLKDEESRTEATLIKEMREQQLTAIGGKLVRLAIPTVPEYVPAVKDWDTFYKHILQTGDFSLLHKRVGTQACKERWDAGDDVPGVERYAVYKLSKSGV
jgi:hypothetical protein